MKKWAALLPICLTPLLGNADGWEYAVAPYLWLPSIDIDSSRVRPNVGLPRRPADPQLTIGPTDYLDALDFGLMLNGEARNDSWVLMGDLIYLELGIDGKDVDLAAPGRGPIAGSYSADLTTSILSLSGGKTVLSAGSSRIDALVGWRRIGMQIEVSEASRGTLVDTDLDINDAFVAINGRYLFGDDRWSLRYYLDAGAGESDST